MTSHTLANIADLYYCRCVLTQFDYLHLCLANNDVPSLVCVQMSSANPISGMNGNIADLKEEFQERLAAKNMYQDRRGGPAGPPQEPGYSDRFPGHRGGEQGGFPGPSKYPGPSGGHGGPVPFRLRYQTYHENGSQQQQMPHARDPREGVSSRDYRDNRFPHENPNAFEGRRTSFPPRDYYPHEHHDLHFTVGGPKVCSV